jgi:hypothetical protein
MMSINPKWSGGYKAICEGIGRHGETMLTSFYDKELKRVRVFAFCLCCGVLEELNVEERKQQ